MRNAVICWIRDPHALEALTSQVDQAYIGRMLDRALAAVDGTLAPRGMERF